MGLGCLYALYTQLIFSCPAGGGELWSRRSYCTGASHAGLCPDCVSQWDRDRRALKLTGSSRIRSRWYLGHRCHHRFLCPVQPHGPPHRHETQHRVLQLGQSASKQISTRHGERKAVEQSSGGRCGKNVIFTILERDFHKRYVTFFFFFVGLVRKCESHQRGHI